MTQEGINDQAPATRNVVTFDLCGEVLAVPASQLREVLEPVRVTRVPGAPPFVAELVNVRGAVVPLADLRVPLKMPPGADGPEARILVLEIPLDGQEMVVGIRADTVHEVTRIGPADLEEIPTVGSRWPPRFVAAIGRWRGHFVTLPDLAAIFADFLAGPPGRAPSAGSSGLAPEPETT
ncbi:chemotaxis protein CheW [Histidinibacterium aquaticum]|uniref:Chemotaxis protein CheW n=1 Tax=Histidinibacterium aquaticum TaxID=2613962 RepID=A0A5J5GJV2_9RHOB|nr:chemotaxis protein CheW [Histidinibacterium aquaticum]KAA9008008.1 chemotaxis protein CheW [Histidinibacterium aquaticum]